MPELATIVTKRGVEVGVGVPDPPLENGDVIVAMNRAGQGFAVMMTWDEFQAFHDNCTRVRGSRHG